MKKSPKVFVIVLNWNRADDTIKCLKSLAKCHLAGIKCEIVVVDNASTDDSVKKIRKLKFKILNNSENLGFAGGNNVGIKYAMANGADYVFILNNDTLVSPDVIVQLVKAARDYKEVAVFSPKIYFAPGFEFHKRRYKKSDLGKVIWCAGGGIDWDNVYGYNMGIDEVDHGQWDKTREIGFATGTAMFIRASVLKQMDMFFNELYYMYLEEVDFCLRTKKLGHKIMYVPQAVVWHKVGQTAVIGSELSDYYLSRNRMLFGMTYAPLRAKIALVRQSLNLLVRGREWEKRGIMDFFRGNFRKGSYK